MKRIITELRFCCSSTFCRLDALAAERLGMWASRPHLSAWHIFLTWLIYYLVPEVRAGRPHPQPTTLNNQLCKRVETNGRWPKGKANFKILICLAFAFSCAEAYSQRTCKVVDMLTGLPLADVRVIADHFESKAVTTNRMGEFIILSDDYKFLTFNADGYLSRILSVEEVGDTIELLSNNNRCDEFVVYGKDPLKNAAINKHLKNMIKKESFGASPSGIDILGLFKRKKSARSREKSRKTIENY